MGEMTFAAITLEAGATEALQDADFWLPIFRMLREHGAEEDPKADVTYSFASGADDDAQEFYAAAPTKAARRDAIIAAGKILAPKAKEIYAAATAAALSHVRVLNEAMNLCIVASGLTKAASVGVYGEASVREVVASAPSVH
jgi:hypothetical protein